MNMTLGIYQALTFLLGSMPFGLIVAKFFDVRDLTSQGSGNIGATNVTRVLGFWPAGAITFLLDFLKGALPVLVLASGVLSQIGPVAAEFSSTPGLNEIWLTGLVAVLGHCYSPWLNFRGGKGVATGFGALVVLSPWAALAGLVAFTLTFINRRMGSIASLLGVGTAAVVHLATHSLGPHLLAGGAMIAVIVIRHESNIDALLQDRENQF